MRRCRGRCGRRRAAARAWRVRLPTSRRCRRAGRDRDDGVGGEVAELNGGLGDLAEPGAGVADRARLVAGPAELRQERANDLDVEVGDRLTPDQTCEPLDVLAVGVEGRGADVHRGDVVEPPCRHRCDRRVLPEPTAGCGAAELGEPGVTAGSGFGLGAAGHGAALAGVRVDVGGLVAAFGHRVDRPFTVGGLGGHVDGAIGHRHPLALRSRHGLPPLGSK